MIKYISLKLLNFFDYYYQLKLFKFLKKRGYSEFNCFFDIGAHKGETLELFLNHFKITDIFSFEPSSINFNRLKKNSIKIKKKFKHTNISIENYALGNEKKEINMKQVSESSSSTINDINTNSNYFKKKSRFLFNFNKELFYKDIIINQITLSDYISENKISNIDFLKIDTEGYEFNVLLGLKNDLKRVKLIMFEHHYHDMLIKNYKFNDIHQLLKKNHFEQVYKYKMAFRKTFEYIYEYQNDN
tara:strand:- start:479 stop:1210 length:732 start_codon:yes stop_codon:yes gene_type:complete